ANRALYTPDPEKEGGTTLTAAVIIGRRMFLVHAGDSRAYLLHDRELKILTKDHSVVQRLQDAGHITAAEAERHPHRHLLYKAITGGEVDLDEDTFSLPKRGKLMLCSDGLWGSIPDEKLQEILEDDSMTLQEQADLLVNVAIESGSTDNVTAIIVDFRL
ncbi:MAG: serine/threonine-protein phosphatase, partial [Anaerolineales bacterium]|nr:serine/threonine-protein phosphatase [Anaerolineales bacterium]